MTSRLVTVFLFYFFIILLLIFKIVVIFTKTFDLKFGTVNLTANVESLCNNTFCFVFAAIKAAIVSRT